MRAKKFKPSIPQEVVSNLEEAIVKTGDCSEIPTIPPCPPSDPSLSIKTPAVIEWWFTYHPAQAAVMYAGLTLPKSPN